MMRSNSPDRRMIDTLLADRALQGLSPAKERLLQRLLGEHPDGADHSLDRIVALLDIATAQRESQPMPDDLRDRAKRHTHST